MAQTKASRTLIVEMRQSKENGSLQSLEGTSKTPLDAHAGSQKFRSNHEETSKKQFMFRIEPAERQAHFI